MAATSKAQLLQLTDKEYAKLRSLIADIPAQAARVKGEEDTSIQDIVAHRAHWIDLFLGWYRDGQVGERVYYPAKGYKWNELKRYNAELRAALAHLSWDEAKELLEDRANRLHAFIEALSNEELYVGPMQGAENQKWTVGRWAEAAGPSHYRSATKAIRAMLRHQSAEVPPAKAA